MLKKIIVILILFPFVSQAQYGERIRTARPGKAIGAFALGKNVFQLQTGYNSIFINQSIGSSEADKIFSQNTVLRLGLTEHFEISAVVNWSSSYKLVDTSRTSVGGISGTQFGARYNFTTNDGFLPTIGLQYRALLKVGSEGLRRNTIGSRFILSTGNKLTKKVNLTTNWILNFDSFETEPTLNYAVKASYSISKNWSTFLEAFGGFSPVLVNFDTGLAYLVNKDFQLDISAGIYDDYLDLDFFYDFGISWRFDWRK